MPLLTDRQEPDDFDKGQNPEEPNDYAIKYLFKRRNSPALEQARTGRTFLYSGATANLLATAMLVVALEFRLNWQIVVVAIIMVVLSGLAAALVWKRQQLNKSLTLLTLAPAVVLVVALLYALSGAAEPDPGLVLYYLPGALTMLLAVILLRPKSSQTEN